ncbi:MAG: amidotransferase [Thermoleophilia bacterium]|nr:amidotransferase [Thermoleophilia bacterium]
MHTRPVVHCLQHSERVRPLTVGEWAQLRGLELRVVRVDEDEDLPPLEEVERLVVLGGGMNTDDSALHPWLDDEREFLTQVVALGRARVLAICLGSQLVAEVLGGTVGRADVPEIGWHEVELTEAGAASPVFGALPRRFEAMQWHGDAWQLPPGAVLTVTGATCATQGFSFEDRVHAVQFHPEFTYDRTVELAESTTDDLSTGGGVQAPAQFLADPTRFDRSRELCLTLLDRALLDPDGA